MLDCLVLSFDANPIEHVWSPMKKKLTDTHVYNVIMTSLRNQKICCSLENCVKLKKCNLKFDYFRFS